MSGRSISVSVVLDSILLVRSYRFRECRAYATDVEDILPDLVRLTTRDTTSCYEKRFFAPVFGLQTRHGLVKQKCWESGQLRYYPNVQVFSVLYNETASKYPRG
jgi:hypothetical protein